MVKQYKKNKLINGTRKAKLWATTIDQRSRWNSLDIQKKNGSERMARGYSSFEGWPRGCSSSEKIAEWL